MIEDERELQARYERDVYLEERIGPSFGRRKLPRVRETSGSGSVWTIVSGPFKGSRAARKEARRLRDQTGECFCYFKAERKPGRKTSDWFAAKKTGRICRHDR